SEVVGRPVAAMLANDGAKVWSVDIDSLYIFTRGKLVLPSTDTTVEAAVKEADIVILGVPSDKYKMDPSWIKEGAVVINVATTKNIDEKVLLATRPGVRYMGQIGKVTVAMLERNLLRLHQNFKEQVNEGKGGDFYLH
ncbi:thfA, partial [Symbiodinium sp. KB8]